MLMLYDQLIGRTIASVQSGLPCGRIASFIVDPAKLAIELITIHDLHGAQYLLPGDVRYIGTERVIIDAEEKLSEADELLRHQEIIHQNYSPISSKVVTESKKKLGRVTNYAIDENNWRIAKLYVTSGLFGNPLQQEQIIDTGDVVNVEANKIIVRDLRNTQKKPLTIPLPKNVA